MDALKLFVWSEPFETSSGVYVLAHSLDEAWTLLDEHVAQELRSYRPPLEPEVYSAPVAIVEWGVCLQEYTYDG